MTIERAIILVLIAISLISVASATAGTATYYTVYAHHGSAPGPAANRALYNNGAACGKYYNVRCTGSTSLGVVQPCKNGVVRVKIVDPCPGCVNNQLDLSQEAFSTIANLNAGKILIDYTPA